MYRESSSNWLWKDSTVELHGVVRRGVLYQVLNLIYLEMVSM
jgi:hypothetical protein